MCATWRVLLWIWRQIRWKFLPHVRKNLQLLVSSSGTEPVCGGNNDAAESKTKCESTVCEKRQSYCQQVSRTFSNLLVRIYLCVVCEQDFSQDSNEHEHPDTCKPTAALTTPDWVNTPADGWSLSSGGSRLHWEALTSLWLVSLSDVLVTCRAGV